ncbi:hypothetical protein KGF56_001777 [Candida oxycetoniae]|uniref:Cyclin-like domain-containing protein n=1 Tax=Candida oxycetoniae TaxID=497107 RepID=A0AAI9SYG5_9ASCO|nr:uncharacterized protein KGF56_001777 [Candida oxycetoniae]KAI3405433.2 hypothetical protein KGF56_001777 [Candida oxycetoniae]
MATDATESGIGIFTTNKKSGSRSESSSQVRKKRKLAPWIFPESAVLTRSPTRLDSKLTISQELRIKESMHDFLIKLGSKLKVDAPTILAATVYIHRFYMRVPITSSKYYVASAALAISGKLNDCVRQSDTISLYACNIKAPRTSSSSSSSSSKFPPNTANHSAAQPPPPPPPQIDEQSEYFWRWRDQLLYREELILRKLNFDLSFPSPYLLQHKILNKMHAGINQTFYEKRKDIMVRTTRLIELLSSLPIILCYDMNVLFATCLVMVVFEGKSTFSDMKMPENFITKVVEVDLEDVMKCFEFIKKLLNFSQQDPHSYSNKTAAKRILGIKTSDFEQVAKGAPI